MSDGGLALRLIAILFPIFGIVAAGYFYARKHKPEMAVANRLNMDVFVPALVFAALAGKSFDLVAYAPLALGAFLVLAICGLLAWPIAHLLGMQPKTLVPPMLFNNSGNIGLPLAVLAWGEAALPAAVILFMVEKACTITIFCPAVTRKKMISGASSASCNCEADILGSIAPISTSGLVPRTSPISRAIASAVCG